MCATERNPQEKMAIDFLLYTYFGVTSDSNWENCVQAAIMRAYDDTTLEGAFNTQLSEKNFDDLTNVKTAAQEAKKNSAGELFQAVEKLFGDQTEPFDAWHGNICEQIQSCFKAVVQAGKNGENISLFTYGNAQKWVNMTMKYIYLMDAFVPGNEYHDGIAKYASCFHIPVDSYIIDSLWSKGYRGFRPKESINPDYDYKSASNYIVAWSKWDAAIYSQFRAMKHRDGNKSVAEISLPCENGMWIAQAEKRKENKIGTKRESFGFATEEKK